MDCAVQADKRPGRDARSSRIAPRCPATWLVEDLLAWAVGPDYALASAGTLALAAATSVAGTFSTGVAWTNSGYPASPISGTSRPAISTAADTRFEPRTLPMT